MTAYACSIVDPAIHGTSIPATYVAPGNLQNLGVGATAGSTTGTLNANAPATLSIAADTGNTYTVIAANCRGIGGDGNGGIAGAFTQAGSAVDVFVPVGFYPTKVELNVGLTTTEVGFYQWMHGMGAYEISQLVAADTAELTTGAIAVVADSDGGDGNVCYVKFPAALVVASQVCSFRILK
jgi:hypothetical protein